MRPMKTVKSLKLLTVLLIIGTSLFGCSSKEKNLNTADGLFEYAKEFDESERYEVALQKYAEVRNKFPYSSFATEAELAIADVHYKRESYTEAEIAYQNFRDLHPKHPKSDYVLYKIAMSYYMQLPETIDRDLTSGKDAIYHFSELIKIYPLSQFAVEAKTKREDVINRQAQKELYIADFYLKQKKYSAAYRRYENTLAKFPGLGYDPRAHLGAARSAKGLTDIESVKKHTSILFSKYSSSEEAKQAQKEGF